MRALQRRYGRASLPVVDGIQLVESLGPHKIGMVVPPGGSNCSKCAFLREKRHCALALWVNAPKAEGGGGGKTRLPVPASRWCCDGYEPGVRMPNPGK